MDSRLIDVTEPFPEPLPVFRWCSPPAPDSQPDFQILKMAVMNQPNRVRITAMRRGPKKKTSQVIDLQGFREWAILDLNQ